MEKEMTPTKTVTPYCTVQGAVRTLRKQPLGGLTLRAYSVGMRTRQLLSETHTDASGNYAISFGLENAVAPIVLCVYDDQKAVLKESDVPYNGDGPVQLDIEVERVQETDSSLFQELTDSIMPLTEDILLSQLTETDTNRDISFLVHNTGRQKKDIERLAMAARFETLSQIRAYVWFGILAKKKSDTRRPMELVPPVLDDYESRLQRTLDSLMHTHIDALMTAVEQAISENIVAASVTTEFPQIREQLSSFIQTYARQHPITGKPSALYQKSVWGGLKGNALESFLENYNDRAEAGENFWAQLPKIADVKDTGTLAKMQAVFLLARLTGEDLVLTEKLLASEKIQEVADVKKLAAYDRGDWQKILGGDSADAHTTGLTGSATVDVTAGVAARLERSFTRAYPTAAFTARLLKDTGSTLAHRDAIGEFLTRHEQFDLLNTRIGQFLKDNTDALPGKDAAVLADQLRRMQRVFKLTPHYESVSVLLNTNIHSARQVHALGKSNFTKMYGAVLGQDEAEDIFEKASQAHATAVALVGNLKAMADASTLNAFPSLNKTLSDALGPEVPSLETLFGNTDFFDTPECRSVYGAPAYLTDLLHFLDKRSSELPVVISEHGADRSPSVKDIFLRRRPDIGDLDLACSNTNTEIPYIDIACELMEDYIAPPAVHVTTIAFATLTKGKITAAFLAELKTQFNAAGQAAIAGLLTADAVLSEVYEAERLQADNTLRSFQTVVIRDAQVTLSASTYTGTTTGIEVRLLHQTLQTAETIGAGPEYINAGVYNNFLKTAKRTFDLPFDLFETEGELYLEKLGVKKADLVNTFRKEVKPPTAPTPADLYVAYATLGINESEQTLIFVADAAHQSLYWGAIAPTGTTAITLAVDVFEKLSGLTYAEIVTLLGLAFINPSKDSVIEHEEVLSDTTGQKITNLTATKLDAMHRFLRLWRKTTLTMDELDAIVMSPVIGQARITPKLAWQLQQFFALQKNFDLGAFELLAFYQNLDTTHNTPDSLYNRLFQNGRITNPVSPNFSIAAATPGTLGITEPDKAVIAAVLQVTLDDVVWLISKTISRIAFGALSVMFRYVKMSRALGMSLAEFSTLQAVMGVDPFKDLSSTTLFLQKYKLLQSSGLTTDDLNYVLRHQDNVSKTLVPSDGDVSAALAGLQDELLAARAATQPVPDINGVLLDKWLSDPALNWDNEILNKLIDILNTTDDDEYQKKIDDNINFLLSLRVRYLAPSQADTDTDNIFFASASDVVSKLRGILSGKMADRFAVFLTKVSPVYRALLQQNVLIKNISTWFKVDQKAAAQLLVSVPGIYTDFTDDAFVSKQGAPYMVQMARYQFVAKICFVAARLKLTNTDLDFLLAHAGDIGSLSLQNLPLTPVTSDATTFPGFEVLIGLLRFQQYYPALKLNDAPGTTVSVYTLLASIASKTTLTPSEIAAFITALQVLTGWNSANLNALISTPNYLNITFPDDVKSPAILLRLHACFVILGQWGIAAADAINWTKNSLAVADVNKIKQTLKSKYTNADWLAITTPLQNTLREKKRDALIAYLLANPGTQNWKDANDLYSYFLLDVEMCSCQATSRIVQATNSVQLFVQRCFLGLEASVIADVKTDSDWKRWEWMKNFRVWQANVKVFLYPENWIEPELLPDEIKSPFLKELESDLQQNEVTAEHVEDVFRDYLQKLSGVARLEMKGMWYDEKAKELHVLGRTYGGNPRVYYHRKLIDDRRWTPWLKIDLDITSDHILLISYNNRLYLFWAVFTELADDTQQVGVPKNDQGNVLTPPKKFWQIQLAFSEYKDGKWTPTKISNNDDSGRIICNQSDYPARTAFVLTPLDIPFFDYDGIFNDTTGAPNDPVEVFQQKAAEAANQNGTLLINCYYYSFQAEDSFNNNHYIGSFQLDAVRGYPSLTSNPFAVLLTTSESIGPVISTASDRSVMIDMLDTERAIHRHTHINYTTPDQSRGRYRNLESMQTIFLSRYYLLLKIYQTGNSPINTINQLTLGGSYPHFYQDSYRTYYVVPTFGDNGDNEISVNKFMDYYYIFLTKGEDAAMEYINSLLNGVLMEDLKDLSHYYTFYHPLVDYFTRILQVQGIEGLMSRDVQLKGDVAFDPADKFSFMDYYNPGTDAYSGSNTPVTYPNGVVDSIPGYPKEDVDFSLKSGYGVYNWELFFHAPLLVAERLSQNHQFEDADRWYKYIFNPMDLSDKPSPDKYWNTKPFFININDKYVKQRIDKILTGINTGDDQGLLQDVEDWKNNPFQPHYIAQYRTVAYQKVAVMKYVNHLIRHGDYLFNQHTMESVNEATQLYILASEILGPKPEILPSPVRPVTDNYYQLEERLDNLSDAMVEVENLMPLQSIKGYTGTKPNTPELPTLRTLYFSIPMNENMVGATGYWDIVADRLFKIRHCLDINGNLAPLSLFSAPIDPGMLVRAAAAGVSIGSILSDSNAPLPVYRFGAIMQKATELCNEVKALGAAMLSALEKKDSETMALLRSGHEIRLLNAVLAVKQKQIDDAQSALDNLLKQQELITIRQKYYSDLLDEGVTTGEAIALGLNIYATELQGAIALSYVLAGGLNAIPDFTLGVSGLGSPVATAKHGGTKAANTVENAAQTLGHIASALDKGASLINTTVGYQRRADEWKYQLDLATKELDQLDVQIEGGRLRLEIANQDLTNQQLQIDQAREANDFMRNKFTNEELFNWLSTQLSNTYFKSYQLAYDMAKRAERCFRYELGTTDSAYINFGYWDSHKKGLLAGEQLAYDLKRMDVAYLEQNTRELELTKHISLAQLDPAALLKLRTSRECWVNLPEELFDMDYPGHYMRRIKSVSLTIPCITGPYTTVSCTLTMTKNSVRISGIASGDASQYSRKLSGGVPADDPRFRDAVGALQSIATSSAQNDNGLFEINFRDERYLPFEGCGVISLLHLQLPAVLKQFDYNTISDVILHVRYTARDGGEALKADATASLTTKINQMLVSIKDRGLMQGFSARNDLAVEWHQFLNPLQAMDDQILTLNLDQTRFPLFVQGRALKITSIELAADSTVVPIRALQIISPAGDSKTLDLTASPAYGSWLSGTADYTANKKDPGTWVIKNPSANARLTTAGLKNLIILVHYEIV